MFFRRTVWVKITVNVDNSCILITFTRLKTTTLIDILACFLSYVHFFRYLKRTHYESCAFYY